MYVLDNHACTDHCMYNIQYTLHSVQYTVKDKDSASDNRYRLNPPCMYLTTMHVLIIVCTIYSTRYTVYSTQFKIKTLLQRTGTDLIHHVCTWQPCMYWLLYVHFTVHATQCTVTNVLYKYYTVCCTKISSGSCSFKSVLQ